MEEDDALGSHGRGGGGDSGVSGRPAAPEGPSAPQPSAAPELDGRQRILLLFDINGACERSGARAAARLSPAAKAAPFFQTRRNAAAARRRTLRCSSSSRPAARRARRPSPAAPPPQGVLVGDAPPCEEGRYAPRDHVVRPGLAEQLLRLAGPFRLGVYSSATLRTVTRALGKINSEVDALRARGVQGARPRREGRRRAATRATTPAWSSRACCMALLHGCCMVLTWCLRGACMGLAWCLHGACMVVAEAQRQHGSDCTASPPPTPHPVPGRPLFEVLLTRDDCAPDPHWRDRPGGKEWSTVKPLAANGLDLASTVLVDNDWHKSVAGEAANMLLVPDWVQDRGEAPGAGAGRAARVGRRGVAATGAAPHGLVFVSQRGGGGQGRRPACLVARQLRSSGCACMPGQVAGA
jgi:hypothetical protein